MRSPVRLLEDGATATERTLLRAGLAEEPSESWMRDTRAALGLATGLAAASTIASVAPAAKWSAPLFFTWLGGLLAATVVVGSLTFVAGRRVAPAPVVLPVVDDRVATAAPESVPEPAPAADENMPVESAPTAPRRAERALGTPKTLSAEIASLDSVKQYLVTDNPAAALNALARYHASFPAPMLGPEATVLEVQVLMADGDVGHRARAIALARRFVRMHPTSPHAPQLEMLISKAHEP
jgi:hypothetical protein